MRTTTVTGWLMAAVFVGVLASTPAARSDGASGSMLDELIFLNGRVVKGEIIEETAQEVVILVRFGNLPPTRTTYLKSDLLEVKHDVVPAAGAAVGSGVGGGADETDEGSDGDDPFADADAEAAKLYVVEWEGQFGSDISETPLTKMFEDVDRVFGDLVPSEFEHERVEVVDPSKRDKHIVVIKLNSGTDPRFGFDGMWRAEELGRIIKEQIQVKGRRVVFWVDWAADGTVFLPWVSQEIYFTDDGVMLVTSDLEDFDIGDQVVNEKQISLRLATAHGFAIDGGYGSEAAQIINAMARRSYWLAMRYRGGQPELMQRRPTEDEVLDGWEVLSDDGQGDRGDGIEQVTPWNAHKFNDRLVLDARLARLMNVSDGTADDIEELASRLGVSRNYVAVEDRGDEFFEDWSAGLERGFEKYMEIQNEEFPRIQVAGDYADRSRARGRQINMMRQMRSLLTQYAEVLDPNGQQRSQLDIQIEVIKKQQQQDRAANRGRAI